MSWYLKVLKKYAVFSGRARRKEYWMFVLFNIIVSLALGFVAGFAGALVGADLSALSTIYSLAIFIPSVSVGVRRMHDTNRSGWWLFLFVPLFFNGHPNDNQYGPDPKADAPGNAYGQNDALRLTPRHDDTLQQVKTLTRPCPDCGEPILLVARKCKHCGSAVAPIGAEPSGATPLPESRPTVAGAARRFCSECGSQMLESDKFCQKCGTAQETLSR